MLRLSLLVAVGCCIALTSGQGFVGYVSNSFSLLLPRSLETIEYTGVRNASARDPDSYEERSYPSAKWACTARTIPGSDSSPSRAMFFELFRYFSGDNEARKDIDLTLPVVTIVKKRDDSTYHETCLYIPKEFQEDTPKPSNPAVFVEQKPKITVFTRRISGYVVTEAAWNDEVKALQKILEAKEPQADFSYHYRANYDTPLRIFNRRTEVWFVAKAQSESSEAAAAAETVEAQPVVAAAEVAEDKPAAAAVEAAEPEKKKAEQAAKPVEKKVAASQEPAENRE